MSSGDKVRVAKELRGLEKNAHAESDMEKENSLKSEEYDAAPSDQISQASTHDENTHLSREHTLVRTKSRTAEVISKVASRLTMRSITQDPGPPPDGGRLAWLQCFCGWVAILNTWGFVNSFGAFQTHYTNTLPESPSTISWIGSIQAFLMFFIGTFSGRALDAGYFRPTIIIGIVFQVVGVFMMSLSTKYWQLLLTQGVMTGIGGGIFFCPIMGLMSTYFAKNRGLALGVATSGNAFGGMIYPIIVRQLLPQVGFGWTVRVLGFINLVTLAVVVAFMKPRLPPRKSGPIVELSALKDIPYVLFVLGVSFIMAAIYFVFYYIASYATDVIGMNYTSSLNLVIILNGVGVPARILPGFLADRYFGVLNTFIPLICINIILLFAWLGVSGIASFYTWTILYGMFAAGWQSLFPTAVASLGTDLSKAGTRLGMAFSTIAFAALVGGPIGGAILQADGGRYTGSIIWAAVSTCIGTCLIIAARVKSKGWGLVKC